MWLLFQPSAQSRENNIFKKPALFIKSIILSSLAYCWSLLPFVFTQAQFSFIDSPGTRSLQLFIAFSSSHLILSCCPPLLLSGDPSRLFRARDQIIILQSSCQPLSFLFLLSSLYWCGKMLYLYRRAVLHIWEISDLDISDSEQQHKKIFCRAKIVLLIICYVCSFCLYLMCTT